MADMPLAEMEERVARRMAPRPARPRGWGRGKANWKQAPGAVPPGQAKPRMNSDVPHNRPGKLGAV